MTQLRFDLSHGHQSAASQIDNARLGSLDVITTMIAENGDRAPRIQEHSKGPELGRVT